MILSTACTNFRYAAQATGIEAIDFSKKEINLPCSITLEQVKDPRGVGDSRTWIKITLFDCSNEPITWSIDNNGYVEPWHVDPTYAWMAGVEGSYTITAEVAGATASITVNHVP